MLMDLRIGYVNVHSLQDGKFYHILGMLEKKFDFIFVAEHWYTKHASRLANTAVIGTTVLPRGYAKRHVKGRFSGGIYLLASDRWKGQVLGVVGDQYGIVARLKGFSFAGVYYPPTSMTTTAMEQHLLNLPAIDLVLGDINVRFPGQQPVGPTDRIQAFQHWQAGGNFMRMAPSFGGGVGGGGIELTTDHAFISNAPVMVNSTLTLHSCWDLNIHTDHTYMMEVDIDAVGILNAGNAGRSGGVDGGNDGVLRFRINRLRSGDRLASGNGVKRGKKKDYGKLFRDSWGLLQDMCNWKEGSEEYDVDMLDMLLVGKLQSISEEVLGIVRPTVERRGPDRVVGRLSTATDIDAAIGLFKRTQRSSTAGKTIISELDSSTPMEECEAKYEKVYNSSTPSSMSTTNVSSTSRSSSSVPCVEPLVDDVEITSILLGMVSEKRVKAFISRFPGSKSCGEDGIHALQMKALLDTSFITDLSLLFQACILTGSTPERWNRSILYPIRKDSSLPYTAANTRPISILVMFRRVFESLILPAFEDPSLPFNTVDAGQGGFRKGYSTLTHALTLHHSLATKALPIAVFLDFEAAFDMVGRDRLVEELHSQGMPALLVQLVVQLMFTSMSYSLIVNGASSGSHQRVVGIPQGSPLSPVMFNKFVNSLVVALNATVQDASGLPSSLFFADDGVLMCRDWMKATVLLDVCERWAVNHDMRFKVSKCGVVTTKTMHNRWHTPLSLYGSPLPVVNTYRYLGFPVTCDGIDFDAHRDRIVEKTLKLKGFLQLSSDSWTPRVRLNLFKVYLRPIMEYGLPLFDAWVKSGAWLKFLKPLELAWNECMVWVAGGTSKRPKLFGNLCGVLEIRPRMEHLRCSFQHHLYTMDASNPLRNIVGSLSARRPKTLLVGHLAYDKLYGKFREETVGLVGLDAGKVKEKLVEFLAVEKSAVVGKRDDKTGTMLAIVEPEARLVGLDMVAVLGISNGKQQTTLWDWRRGLYGFGRMCLCGERWDRGHVRCMSMSGILTGVLTEEEEELMELDKVLHPPDTKYTVIDYLLNIQAHDRAYDILAEWSKRMADMFVAGRVAAANNGSD